MLIPSPSLEFGNSKLKINGQGSRSVMEDLHSRITWDSCLGFPDGCFPGSSSKKLPRELYEAFSNSVFQERFSREICPAIVPSDGFKKDHQLNSQASSPSSCLTCRDSPSPHFSAFSCPLHESFIFVLSYMLFWRTRTRRHISSVENQSAPESKCRDFS